MSTVFSPPFRFAEWHSYVINSDDASTWSPDMDPSGKGVISSCYVDIENKWVYVFQDLGGTVSWYGEYQVKNGFINPVLLEGNREKERDQRPEPQLGCDWMRLPHTINGCRAYYYTYVSRMRLPIDAVRQLTRRAPDVLPYMDLDGTEEYGITGLTPHKIVYNGAAWVYPCVEPITIALHLARYYQAAANDLIGFTTVYQDQPAAQRKRVEERNKTKMLGEILTSILDSDPDDKLGLRNEFASGGERAMRSFLSGYDAKVKEKTRETDRRGSALCHWLRSELMTIAEVAHFIEPEKDAAAFLNPYAQCVDRLQESTPGKAYLAYLVQTESHFVHEYVLRSSPASEGIFQIGRKCASAILGLWKELAGVHIKLRGKDTARALAISLEYITRVELLAVQVTPKHILIATKEQRMVRLRVEIVTVKVTPQAPAKIANWIQDGHPVAKVLGELTLWVEIVNLGLSLKSLITADPGLSTVQAALGALGSSLDMFSAVGAMLKFAEKPLFIVGGISAVIDVVCAGFDAYAAASRNDYSAMIGYGLGVGLGSALIAVGCFTCAAGAGSSATVIGMPPGVLMCVVGGILVAAGWIVAIFTADSEMELFVSHCLWGDDYGSGSDNPNWAGGSFREWKDNLDRQLTALFNILCAFRLDSADYTAVKIWMGMVNPTSKFYISFDCEYNHGRRFKPQLCLEVGTKTMTQAGGDPADLTAFRFGEQDGQKYIQVAAELPPGKDVPMLQWRYASCEVYMDLSGDAQSLIPSSGAKVPYFIKALGGVLNLKDESSKNF
ncbi:MAG TPA: hypothetical protein VFQ91_27070 [Bryobacteraceae bacterium]|nr:hypothetical protein [Bryobacteraceae bacterium]